MTSEAKRQDEMTIADQAAENLYNELERGGAIARITARSYEKLESEEAIKGVLAAHLKLFLLTHWPDVQAINLANITWRNQ